VPRGLWRVLMTPELLDKWQQHVAYVAQREADRRRTGE